MTLLCKSEMGFAIAPPFSAAINGSITRRQIASILPPTTRRCSSTTWRFSSQPVRLKACQALPGELQVEDAAADEEACELVNGSELTIGDGNDAIRADLFTAVKNNKAIGILLLSDIFGFDDSATRDFAYRTACNGYNVLVPDLFRGNSWKRDQPRSNFEQWLAAQDPDRVARDIASTAKWMVEEFQAAEISNKFGVVGFCFGGGRVTELLAGDDGARFGTGVSFYGTRMDKEVARGVKKPVLFIAGDNDPLCPVETVTELSRIISNGSEAVVFEGRGHGFAHRPESAEEDADAEKAFVAMRNWLHDHLALSTSM